MAFIIVPSVTYLLIIVGVVIVTCNLPQQMNLQVYKENCILSQMTEDDYNYAVSTMIGHNVTVDLQPTHLECNNILYLTTTVCQLLLKNDISTKMFHVKCDSGKYLRSLFRTLDINHRNFELQAGCASNTGEKRSIRSQFHQAARFIVDIKNRWAWKKIVIFSDIKVASLLKSLSKHFTPAAIVHSSQAKSFLNVKHQNLYYGAHFFILCNRKNTKFVLNVAKDFDLLQRPQTWIIMSDNSLKNLLENYEIPYDAYVGFATTTTYTPKLVQRPEALLLTNESQKSVTCDQPAQSLQLDDSVTHYPTLDIDLFEIYSVKNESLQEVKFGKWQSATVYNKLTIDRPFPNMLRKFKGVKLRVVTMNIPPYVIIRDGKQHPEEHELEGFYGEIFRALAAEMEFNFSVTVVPEGVYGVRDKNGQWNGIISHLVNESADIALCDLSLTNERKEVVEFSPVLSSGSLRIYYKKPEEKYHFRLYFIPFGWEIWALVLASIVISGLLLHVTNRVSPNSARHLEVEDEKLQKVKDDFSILGCLLAVYNGFVQQGSELDPHETSGKIVFVTVYLSFVIIFSSYTSIFTSFLTIQDNKLLFDTLEELYNDPSYKIGILKSSSQQLMFEEEKDKSSISYKVWKRINQDEKNLVKNIQEGLNLAFTSKFAFLTHKEPTAFFLRNNCSFDFSSEEIQRDTYHMVYKKNFPYSETFNEYIERMVESGIIQRMNQHYQKDKIQFCGSGDSVQSLGFKRVVSLFLLLAGASLFAAAVLGVEWILRLNRVIHERNKFPNEIIHVNEKISSKPQSNVTYQTSPQSNMTYHSSPQSNFTYHSGPFVTKQYYYS